MESISQTYERKKRRLESSDDTPGTKKFKVHVTLKYTCRIVSTCTCTCADTCTKCKNCDF